jgi:hypothetical protein
MHTARLEALILQNLSIEIDLWDQFHEKRQPVVNGAKVWAFGDFGRILQNRDNLLTTHPWMSPNIWPLQVIHISDRTCVGYWVLPPPSNQFLL